MKRVFNLVVVFVFIPFLSFSQGSIGFEAGDFNAWQGKWGFREDHPPGLNNNFINAKGLNWPVKDDKVNFSLIDENYTDSCIAFDMDPPVFNGQGKNYYYARLGNASVGWGSEQLYYSFVVTNDKRYLAYKYLYITYAQHDSTDNPYLKVKIIDQNSDSLPCSYMMSNPARDNPTASTYCGSSSQQLVYSNWNSRMLDLSAYLGQTLTLFFETADCAHGAHAGYAYIDAMFVPSNYNDADVMYLYCPNDSLRLDAGNSGNYLWNNGNKTRQITVKDTGSYSVTITKGNSCSYKRNIIVKKDTSHIIDFKLVFKGQVFDLRSYSANGTTKLVNATYKSTKWIIDDTLVVSTSANMGTQKFDFNEHKVCFIAETKSGCIDTVCRMIPSMTTSFKETLHADVAKLTDAGNHQYKFLVSGTNAAYYTYKLYDISGRAIAFGNISNNDLVDLSGYNKGLYVFSVQTKENMVLNQKIILY